MAVRDLRRLAFRPSARAPALGGPILLAIVTSMGAGLDSGRAAVDPLREEFVAPRLGERLDRVLSQYERYGFSGAVLVSAHGLIVLHKSYGLADRAQERPARVETVFPVGALERQFAVAAVLRLQADGRLSIRDPLASHLSSAPAAWRNRPIEELLRGGDDEVTDLLPALVEAVSGDAYASFLAQRLIRPSRMGATFFLDDPPAGADTALAVGGHGGSRLAARLSHLPMPRQAIQLAGRALARRGAALAVAPALATPGGLASTPGDLFRWELAVRGGAILPESERSIFLGLTKSDGPLAWREARSREHTRLLLLEGAPRGFDAAHLRYVEDEMTVILLANSDMGWTQAVRASFEEIVYGEDYSFPFAVLAVVVTFLLLRGAMRRTRGRPRRPRRRNLWDGLLPG